MSLIVDLIKITEILLSICTAYKEKVLDSLRALKNHVNSYQINN